MTFSESLVVGVLVAIVGWIIKSVVGLFLRRRAIAGALLLDIQTRIDNWNRNMQFLNGLVNTDLKAGATVPYTALFQASQTTLFDSLLSELISHLPDHFPSLSKIYGAFKEAEELLAGLLRDISVWKEKAHPLSEEDIKYLRAKRDRIASYVAIFNKQPITALNSLPKDYRGVQGTEAITASIPGN